MRSQSSNLKERPQEEDAEEANEGDPSLTMSAQARFFLLRSTRIQENAAEYEEEEEEEEGRASPFTGTLFAPSCPRLHQMLSLHWHCSAASRWLQSEASTI